MYKLPYTGAEIEERLAKLDNLNAENFLLSETTADLYGLSGVDANVDKALEIVGEKTNFNYAIFVQSGQFVVPDGVTQLRISGCASGGSGSTSKTGGKAGEYIIDTVKTVTPGQTLSIVCGSGNTTISELSISLLANYITTSFPNLKFGIPTGINGSNGAGTNFADGGYGGAFGYGGGGGGGNTGAGGMGGNPGSNTGGGGGAGTTGGNGQDGNIFKTLFNFSMATAGGGGGGTTVDNAGEGGNSYDANGATISGGVSSGSSVGGGGGAGGFGAGGGGGYYSNGGSGSPGFILIEW